MREDTRGRVGEGIRKCGALEALKAWCELRPGRPLGPSDVAEERMVPCRAQWGHDLSMGRTLEKPGPKRQFTRVRGRSVLGTSPWAQALEGKHPVCFRREPGHVRGRSPPAVERSQALLVLGGPTGHSTPLSDVDGNLVLSQLAEQFSGGRYAHALQALDVLFDHQLGSIPGEDHPDLLPDIEGAVGRYVQRHGGQGRVFHPLGDYV